MGEHWARPRIPGGARVRYVGAASPDATWTAEDPQYVVADVEVVDDLETIEVPAGATLVLTVARGAAYDLLERVAGAYELAFFECHGDTLHYVGVREARPTKSPLEVVQKALAFQRKQVAALRVELELAKQQYVDTRRSKTYRLGWAFEMATKNPRDALKLPLRIKNLDVPYEPPPPPPPHPRMAQLSGALERFVEHVRTAPGEEVVFLFSGTTFIQPRRANRPIRLARMMLERGIFTLFSYHGTLAEDPRPAYQHDRLLELPVQFTQQVIADIARADFGDKRKILFVSYPHELVAYRLNLFNTQGWASIYDCRDDWEAFHEVGQAPWYRPEVERYVVNNVDQTYCVSRPLAAKMASLAFERPVGVSPNAYDSAFLAADYERAPTDEVVIGYFGHLSAAWFDWPGLAKIAAARPSWRFEIIGHLGPADPDVPPNVHLLGSKTHAEICRIARRWRVGIIPFSIGPVAEAVDPIKIYEYFALGLPVVSFRMPQIDDYPHTRTVESVPEFVRALDAAVEEPVDAERLAKFIADNTWAHRLDQLMGRAREVLAAPPFEKQLHAKGASCES
ncbi:MAG: methyltransferase [Deltaproteobacteria bacterium]